MTRIALLLASCAVGMTALLFAAEENKKGGKDGKKGATEKDAPKALRPTNLFINTKADEDEPHQAGNALYYSTITGGKSRIYMSTRPNPAGFWGKGKPIVDNFDTEEDRSEFFVSERTGFQYFFFATLRDKSSANYDIFVVQRTDPRKTWSAITAVQAVCTEADEMHPWITADRKTMYFSRKTKDGWRVCCVNRPTPNGPQFQGDAKIIEEIPVGFAHATLTPDGKAMYLQGPLNDGRWGLFVSTKMGEKWGKPEALDLLNSVDASTGDRSPSLASEGRELYFVSDRPGGKGGLDLWVIPTSQLVKRK